MKTHKETTARKKIIQRDMRVTSGHYTHGSVTGVFTSFIARVVYIISGVISVLLGLRFILSLLGANPANPLANFVYNTSSPLVAPFANLFNYEPHYGISRFDFETLIALVVYGLIAWLVISFVSLGDDLVE